MFSTRASLLAIALISGAAALIYQMIWLRWFQVLFGSTAYAASATLCAFFAGLALGAELFGRLAPRSSRPLIFYAGIELGAALLALAVPGVFAVYDLLYPTLYAMFADSSEVFVAVKFLLAMLAMLPPALLLGGTFPMLATAYVSHADELGAEAGRLYAVNTLGAAAGSAMGALWLPEVIGVVATYAVAIGSSLLVAAGAALLGRRQADPVRRVVDPDLARSAAPVEIRPAAGGALRTIAFASGFGTLALEVLLIHGIAQHLDHSVYSYGAVLVVVLLSLATGAWLVSVTGKVVSAHFLLGAALVVEACLLWLLPAQFAHFEILQDRGGLIRGLHAALLLGGPALVVGSLVLPLTFRLAAGGVVGRDIGGLLASNTVGGILGSILASFFLLATFGTWPSIALIGLGYAIAAIVAAGSVAARIVLVGGLLAIASGILSTPLHPWKLPRVALEDGATLVDLREGPYGVVSVIDRGASRVMKINNHYTLSGAGPLGARKERTGHIPLLLHPRPTRVAFVGSATGHTSGAAVLHPVDEIVLVEIVPEVQQLAAEHFEASNRGVHHDPRTRLVVEDGRNHLRATDERFDVIVADLFSPWRSGVGSLYTREHFESVRDHLAEGGVFCQWLPGYQHDAQTFATLAATFLEVFPDAYVWRADFYRTLPRIGLIGFRDGPPEIESVNARVRELAKRGAGDPWVTNPRAFWMFYVGPLAALWEELEEAAINSDSRPRFEYLAGRIRPFDVQRFVQGSWPEQARRLLAAAEREPGFAAAHSAARDGADLARLNAMKLAGQEDEYRTLLRALRNRLPAELIERRDPSVAEMWMQQSE